MTWHPFKENEGYDLDYIVDVIQDRIDDNGFTNPQAARIRLDDIQDCGHKTLVWKPEPRSFLASPLDWRAWRTIDGKPILPPHVVPSRAEGDANDQRYEIQLEDILPKLPDY